MMRAIVALGAFAAVASIPALYSRAAVRGAVAERSPVPGRTSPVVLELYQSQGCSSCPPALEVLRKEADLPNVIALSFAVTYWDQLGWKDSFAQPAFTRRQWDYARANLRATVATPQLIVNGRGFVNGSDPAEVEASIARYRIAANAPVLQLDQDRLIVGPSSAVRQATIWLVSYDPRTLRVPIRAGENGGRTLAHKNIVREIEKLGFWTGTLASYRLPQARLGLKRAVLVQKGTGGPIVAARKLG